MAIATRMNIVEQPKKLPYRIVLELSKEEAQALYIVMNLIGGSVDNSSRKYTDNILKALEKCYIKRDMYITDCMNFVKYNVQGGITFSDKL
jgi:hypothetical protein